MEKCKNWKRYKGIRYPKCNNGNPCDACLQKYRENNTELQSRILAFKMFRVLREIEDVNACNGEGFSQEYIENLAKERVELLKEYYAKRYGPNVIPISLGNVQMKLDWNDDVVITIFQRISFLEDNDGNIITNEIIWDSHKILPYSLVKFLYILKGNKAEYKKILK